jgi:hypothetical protein
MPSKKTVALNLRISLTKKADLIALAKLKRLDVTKLVMELIDQLLDANKESLKDQLEINLSGQGGGEDSKQLSGRVFFNPLPGDEQRLNQYAADRLMKTSTLIKLIVRAWLTRDPLMPKHELAALGITSNQLGALGRNLNQFVKHAHAGNYPLPGELLALLERALHLSQLARKEVGEIVKANITSWENDYA